MHRWLSRCGPQDLLDEQKRFLTWIGRPLVFCDHFDARRCSPRDLESGLDLDGFEEDGNGTADGILLGVGLHSLSSDIKAAFRLACCAW